MRFAAALVLSRRLFRLAPVRGSLPGARLSGAAGPVIVAARLSVWRHGRPRLTGARRGVCPGHAPSVRQGGAAAGQLHVGAHERTPARVAASVLARRIASATWAAVSEWTRV